MHSVPLLCVAWTPLKGDSAYGALLYTLKLKTCCDAEVLSFAAMYLIFTEATM